jgi:uncharacterized protein (DUF2147 family)
MQASRNAARSVGSFPEKLHSTTFPRSVAKTAWASAVAMLAATAAPSALAVDLSGTWLTGEREALVRIAPCGRGAICGTVAWLREPIDPETGKRKTDSKNPDPGKRARPLIGVRVFYDMKPSGPDQWSGKIYSTDDGAVVDGQLIATGPDELRIQGCLGAFCGSQNWTRQRASGRRG